MTTTLARSGSWRPGRRVSRTDFARLWRSIFTVYRTTFVAVGPPAPTRRGRDTTDRVLWYFGKNQGAFEAPKMPTDFAIPAHIKDQATNSEPRETEDKTILMQVQNILQRLFAKSTPCGQPVWLWSYTCDEEDSQLFSAHVEIPGFRRTFVGSWCRGKKVSQRNTCLKVKSYLDNMMHV